MSHIRPNKQLSHKAQSYSTLSVHTKSHAVLLQHGVSRLHIVSADLLQYSRTIIDERNLVSLRQLFVTMCTCCRMQCMDDACQAMTKTCSFGVQIVDVDECQHIISEYSWGNLNLPCSSTDMMYLIYTSGSTGNPKGVMEDHVCLVNLIDWSIDAWELSSDSSVLLKTAVSFDPSVFEIFAPLALGGRLVIAKPGGHEDYNYMKDLVTTEKYVAIGSACLPRRTTN